MTFFEWSLVSERKQQIVGSWVTSFSLFSLDFLFKSKVNSGCPEAGQSESMLLKDEDWNDFTKQNK